MEEVERPEYNPINTHHLAPYRKHLPAPVLISWNVTLYDISSRKANQFYHMLWFWSLSLWNTVLLSITDFYHMRKRASSCTNTMRSHYGSSGKTVALFTDHIFLSLLPEHFLKLFLAMVIKWLLCISILESCLCILIAYDC